MKSIRKYQINTMFGHNTLLCTLNNSKVNLLNGLLTPFLDYGSFMSWVRKIRIKLKKNTNPYYSVVKLRF